MQMQPSLRERKKAQTRDALVAAAYALFQRDGFEATTVDAIADAAVVSRRTFFRYFPTKEAVVFPHNSARLSAFTRALADSTRGEPFSRLRQAVVEMGRVFMSARAELLLQNELIRSAPALVVYELELDAEWERAMAAALTPEDATPESSQLARVVAGAAMGAIRATLRSWYEGGARDDLVSLGQSALDMLEHGFSSLTRPV